MEDLKSLFKEKRNIINLLIVGILIIAIPFVIKLLQEQQIIKSRAAGNTNEIKFTGANIIAGSNGSKFTLDQQGRARVGLELTSPLGPAVSVTPGPTPSPSVSVLPPPPPPPSVSVCTTAAEFTSFSGGCTCVCNLVGGVNTCQMEAMYSCPASSSVAAWRLPVRGSDCASSRGGMCP